MRTPLRLAVLAVLSPALLMLPGAPAGASASHGEEASIEALHAAFPDSEWERAELVARCESGLQASAVSPPNSDGTRDRGLFQLNDGGTLQGLLRTTGESDLGLALDPTWNARAAKALHESRGWQPWTCAARLGIVSGLWSSTPGPNGGDRPFDPAQAPDQELAQELHRQSEFVRMLRREAAQKRLGLAVEDERGADAALVSAEGDLRVATRNQEEAVEALAEAEEEVLAARTFAVEARARAAVLDAELEDSSREHTESQRQLAAEVRATYMGSRTESLQAVKDLVTSTEVEDALQAQGFVGEVLEGQGRLAARAADKRRAVEELTRSARVVREQASQREAAARRDRAGAEVSLATSTAVAADLTATVRTATAAAERAHGASRVAREALDLLG